VSVVFLRWPKNRLGFSGKNGGVFLRRVNDHGHSCVTVTRLCTIDPDGIRVVDGDHEDIWIQSAVGGEETAPDSVGGWCAGAVEGGLSNGMAAWVEFKLHGIAYSRLKSVWIVHEFAIVTHFDGVLGREAGHWEEKKKDIVAHFYTDKDVSVVEYTQVGTKRFWDSGRP
jgi:hypothetical protein